MTETPEQSSLTNSINENLSRIREETAAACNRYGRGIGDVKLIAVSKTQPVAAIQAAVDAGQLDFGENQIQDALTKIPHLLGENLNWHFIGPLQSNKAKHLPGNFNWWHTLNRSDVAQRVSSKAIENGKTVNTLIQVNIVNDPAKSGVTSDKLAPLIDALLETNLEGIKLRGLMTIGPREGSEPNLRRCFAELRSLLQANRARFGLEEFDQLSMGMTNDMEQAVAEGATMLRIGSAIFGSR